jgi:hypothetical protein
MKAALNWTLLMANISTLCQHDCCLIMRVALIE